MNQRGLLFSVMMLFIAIAFISMNYSLSESTSDVSFTDRAIFQNISARYDNIYNSVASFYNGYSKTAAARSLPFDFEVNDTNFSFEQKLPLSASKTAQLFDALNSMEVFFEDTSRANIFDGTEVSLTVPKNSTWGGSDSTIPILINPQCMEYINGSKENLLLKRSTSPKCSSSFDEDQFERIELTVQVSSDDDFNSFLCNNAACPSSSFNPANTNPYYKITIDDSLCSDCSFSSKTASAHFDPSVELNITLNCSPSPCTSSSLLKINQKDLDFNISHAGTKVSKISGNLVFENNVNDFFVPGADILVSSHDGNIYREN